MFANTNAQPFFPKTNHRKPHPLNVIPMLFDPSRMNVKTLRALVRKLSEKYSRAIKDDRPLKDVKEIKKAIHYVERKIAEVEEVEVRADQ
jgi:hypothetical protein